jgi:FkbM family methyltransferase
VNFQNLIHNISRNKLKYRIKALSCALSDKEGFFDFNYKSFIAWLSKSQLNDTRYDKGIHYNPVFSELKYTTTIDKLIENNIIKVPNMIKIDIDGNEIFVLKGMKNLLNSKNRPRSIQVEINNRNKDSVNNFMSENNFIASEMHYSMKGKKEISRGKDKALIIHNVIFRPKLRCRRSSVQTGHCRAHFRSLQALARPHPTVLISHGCPLRNATRHAKAC